MSGILFVISAPSGGGKSTIAGAVRQRLPGLGYSVSHTTRKPRGNEQDGVDYHFVDAGTFMRMADAGDFVEWARVYDHLYGTAVSEISAITASGADILLDVDVQGGRNIKARFPESVLIFLVPPSLQVLEERLRGRRTDAEAVIRGRMDQAADDIANCAWYDYIIVNDVLEKAIDAARSVIITERCRTRRRLPQIRKMFDV